MAKLVWDANGSHFYETGVKKGVLYPQSDNGTYPKGVAWNGLSSINENPSGADANAIYADDIKYLNLISAEEFGATVEAYTYPDEFMACDGSATLAEGVFAGQQTRQKFGLSYVTTVGNDVAGSDYGYKIHLIYNCTASPSSKQYQTINDSPEAITFSWEVSTTATEIGEGFKPTATIVIDSKKVDPTKLAAFEEMLYGKDGSGTGSDAHLPSPAEVYAHFKAA